MPESFLVNTDANGVQDYIFATPKLKLVRGASRIQTMLNRELLPLEVERLGGHLISANGGTVIASFPSYFPAEIFRDSADRMFREHTCSATVTTVVQEYVDGEFEETLQGSKQKLEKLKNQRSSEGPITEPFWAACEACGLQPASHRSKHEGILCRGCLLRENAILPKLSRDARDLDWIGKQSRPQNYIAFIYLDLDRMGWWLPEQAGNSEHRFTELSKKIELAVQAGVDCGVRPLKPVDGHAIYEVFLVGGDDAMVAVPADRCFEFLEQFLAAYRDRQKDEDPKVSVGMVIAHSHFPIAEFVRISKKLVRSAKAIRDADSIDYEILTSSMTDDVLEDRRRVMTSGDGRWRTGKPYTIEAFLQRKVQIVELKENAPASKIRSLYPMAYRGLYQAGLEYLWLLSRSNEPTKSLLREAVGHTMWQTQPDGKFFTRAADLAELWEFAHEETARA